MGWNQASWQFWSSLIGGPAAAPLGWDQEKSLPEKPIRNLSGCQIGRLMDT
jgi:hypothetical protein